MIPTIDLHLHTDASDGTLAPREVVALCAKAGYQTIAISDHDTVDGVEEAIKAGRIYGVEVIPAIEMSAGDELEIHILGYFADVEEIRILRWLESLRAERLTRAARIVERLKEVNVYIDVEDVRRIAGDGRPCCRPHIARAIVEAGFVKDMNEAFARYLKPGRPGYVPISNPPAGDVIKRMLDFKMVPVLAHGALIKQNASNLTALFESMAKSGLRGMECYHSAYDLGMQRFMLSRAKELNLIVTGGSDFHGANKKDVKIGDGLSDWSTAPADLAQLKKARAQLQS